tara:strand:+ start:2877 stop:3254 length:378 start_codon:yes stop_codon:yes gene_type:complete
MTKTRFHIEPRLFAGLLSEFRKKGRVIPLQAVEVFLLVASGVDTVKELGIAMADEDGNPLHVSSVHRAVSFLRGRSSYRNGKFVKSPFDGYLQVREHPHTRAFQILLTKQGSALVNSYLRHKIDK